MRYRQNTKGDILYGPPVTFVFKQILYLRSAQETESIAMYLKSLLRNFFP